MLIYSMSVSVDGFIADREGGSVTEDIPLTLVETRTFGSRVVYERYRRVRDDSG